MALLEIELKNKCKSDHKLIWPVLFKDFIDSSDRWDEGDFNKEIMLTRSIKEF